MQSVHNMQRSPQLKNNLTSQIENNAIYQSEQSLCDNESQDSNFDNMELTDKLWLRFAPQFSELRTFYYKIIAEKEMREIKFFVDLMIIKWIVRSLLLITVRSYIGDGSSWLFITRCLFVIFILVGRGFLESFFHQKMLKVWIFVSFCIGLLDCHLIAFLSKH